MKKKILTVSVGRSDYDRYYPLLKKLNESSNVKLYLYLTKAHQDKKFGNTENFVSTKFNILKKKFKKKDFKKDISHSFSEDLVYLIKKINILKPDIIIILGDRYEMLLGPIAAIPKNIPIIHFYGGAVTEGAIDELVRHAITKMSHIHFVALEQYKKRLLQLGEEKWRVKNIGVHELNKIKHMKIMPKKIISKNLNFDFSTPYCLFTFHPVTIELEDLEYQLKNVILAIKKSRLNAVITYPNADPQHERIIKIIKKEFDDKKKYLLIKNCGEEKYMGILKHSEFIIGNSSSGIVEAATLKKASINIGTRQDGKFKPSNVISVNYSINNIIKAIKKALNSNFKKKVEYINNPYESKISINKVINYIINLKIDDKLLRKRFINIK